MTKEQAQAHLDNEAFAGWFIDQNDPIDLADVARDYLDDVTGGDLIVHDMVGIWLETSLDRLNAAGRLLLGTRSDVIEHGTDLYYLEDVAQAVAEWAELENDE